MTDDWKPPSGGALDDTVWPERLVAKAVDPSEGRIHGYSVVDDVARHYPYSDLVYLSIVGELPDDRASELFRVALCSLAPIGVNQAPTHVGVLGRICGAPLASGLGAGLMVLADHARVMVAEHAALLAWLEAPDTDPPRELLVPEMAPVDPLRARLPDVVRWPLGRDAARIVVLHAAGLRTPEQIEAAIVAGGLCGLVAETIVAVPSDLGNYPVKLPPFHYREVP